MFNNLANYLLGGAYATGSSSGGQTATGRVEEEETNIRLTAVVSEDDWVMVDRDSEGNSEISSSDSEHEDEVPPFPKHLTRTSSASSLPCGGAPVMEESWFITPPPCFTSAGPVHMETSPLENLLIEHPSMSVYHQHSSVQPQVVVGRRHNSVPIHLPSTAMGSNNLLDNRLDDASTSSSIYGDDDQDVGRPHQEALRIVRQEPQLPRRNRLQVLQQQEVVQCRKNKRAQKVQIHKSHQYLKRNHLERNNKAREVNSRNRPLRRGERSQGATRSYANNNRKC